MSESVIGGVIWPNCKQMGKKKRQKAEKVVVKPITTVDLIGEDLLQIVLSKLPAKSFASAACVNRSWNAVSRRVLDRPKLSSFVSLNPSLQAAVEEVVNKVLNEPTRPHFAILCISPSFKLRDAHRYTREKLGKRIPVVSYKSNGLIGREALTNEFKEIQWDMDPDSLSRVVFYGVSLTVGFLPGLKVDALPLSLSADFQRPAIEKFVIEIRNHTNSVSGCTSPAGIIMFGAEGFHMKHLLDEMDYAMHPDTVIVGDECCKFLYSAVGDSEYCSYRRSPYAGVALLFMKDKDKPRGIGDIQFHVAISAGITPTGPTFKAAAVKEMTEETWLSATTAERRQHINGQTMLHNIDEELGDQIEYPELFIGVTKRRKYSVGEERPGWSTSMTFHSVVGGDETYLHVDGWGIKTGDYFRFYYPKSATALSSSCSVSKDLEKLKKDFEASADKKQAFGGFIFTCCGRGEPFFNATNVDSAPFRENFPGVPFGGTFCSGEIGRGSSSLYGQDERSTMHCCIHAYSSVNFIMSYAPPQLEI